MTDKIIQDMTQSIIDSCHTTEKAKREAKKSKRYILNTDDYAELKSLAKTRYPQNVTYAIWRELWKTFDSHETYKEALNVAMKPLQKFADSHKAGCVCDICRSISEIKDILKQ